MDDKKTYTYGVKLACLGGDLVVGENVIDELRSIGNTILNCVDRLEKVKSIPSQFESPVLQDSE